MLAALVLAGIMAAPMGTAALLVRPRHAPDDRGVACDPPVRFRGGRHGGAGRARGGGDAAARGDRAQHDRRRGRPGRREPGLAAGDPAVERPRPPVLGDQHLPVRRLPGLRSGLDLLQPSRPGEHGRRAAAVVLRGVRRDPGLRLPVGDLRRHRLGDLAPADRARHDRADARRRRAPVRQPARPGAQRAAGHGHRHAPLAAAPRLPALRGHPDRRQHRRRGPVAAGRGAGARGTASSSRTWRTGRATSRGR